MAYLMWKRGRGSIAKALIGNRLCHSMLKLAEESYNTDAVLLHTEQRRLVTGTCLVIVCLN